MLELKNISFDVADDKGQKEIIKNLSLTIDDHKFVVITGPNGGGKSTLAKLIAGIENPTEGQILLNGEDITGKSITERAKLGISFAFQQPVFSFKNISKDPLNISAEELMERFVRGDASRNTEGNGLGLSIARSMTELQGGRMTLSVDGDLFKAMLSFPILAENDIKVPEFVLHP